MNIRTTSLIGCFFGFIGFLPIAPAQDSDFEPLGRGFETEQLVSLATGYAKPVVRAPAVATVITADEIRQLGVNTLIDVLETVPGLHVSTERAVSNVFVIRGFFHPINSQVLVLINGIPINAVVEGGQPQAWSMPVYDISRIEVLRGPGSALYGADAFAGVINVITKTADEINGTEAGIVGGSFDSYGGWLLQGNQWNDFEMALSLQARTTNGYDKTVRADEQSRVDRILGTSASRAPGPLNTGRDDINARVDIAQGKRWRFRAGYQGFKHVGTGAGVALALDPAGSLDVDLINADFTYNLPTTRNWETEFQASYLRTITTTDLTLLPPGTFGGLFQDGLRNAFTYRVDQLRLGGTLLYDGFAGHRLRFGMGINYASSKTTEKRNFTSGPAGIPIPTGRFANIDQLGLPPGLSDEERTILYGYIQDEWELAPDWTLTAGARLDHYSDFGTTFNPRLALVWNAAPDLTLKALYGRAFRPPTFFDLYGDSPVVLTGSKDTKPEIINSLEFVALKRWSQRLTTSLNLFWYETDDLILIEPSDPSLIASPARNRNIAGTRGYGLELESEYNPTPDVRLRFNYAYQQNKDKETNDSSAVAPEHQLYGELNWRFQPRWYLNTRLKWLGKPHDYTLIDLALRRDRMFNNLDFTLLVQNLFDVDASEPTLFPLSLPDGVPLPGRRVMAQLRYRF